jgi:uncharacterized protein YyaL (SSP411 family)
MAALVLQRLSGLASEPRYADLAQHSLGQMQRLLAQHPLAFGQWLIALDYALAHPREIGIVGDSEATGTCALLRVCATGYRPHQIVAVGDGGAESSVVPLLRDRGKVDGRAAAYVCVDSTCRRPVTDPGELQKMLDQIGHN